MAAPARILVTGAGGFVGRNLVPALRAAFPAAVLIGAGREAAIPGMDESHRLDLLDPAGLDAVIAAARPDAVLHLAAQSNVPASFRAPAETWRSNLLGTLALAEAVMREAPEASFLFVSSGEVYGLGFQSGESLDEMAPFQPANPYAPARLRRTWRSARWRCAACAHPAPPLHSCRSGQSPNFAVASFARQVARIEAGRQEPVLRTGASTAGATSSTCRTSAPAMSARWSGPSTYRRASPSSLRRGPAAQIEGEARGRCSARSSART
jgi:GDP-4-dehydro-6-deoxy-D-mannose reductase